MGMSKEERMVPIIEALIDLQAYEPSIRELNRFYFSELSKLLEDLWGALYQCHISDFFLTGSGWKSKHNELNDPVAVALKLNIEDEETALLNGQLRKLGTKNKENERWEYQQEYLPTCERLLEQESETRLVYRCYDAANQALYAIRKYNDRLTEQLQPLTKQLGRVAGFCLGKIRDRDVFRRAWYLGNLVQVATKNKVCLDFWNNCNLQHCVRIENGRETMALHKKYQEVQDKELTLQESLELSFWICGQYLRKYHIGRTFDTILKELNIKHRFVLQLDKLKAILDDCEEMGKLLDKRHAFPRDEYCYITQNYGGKNVGTKTHRKSK